MMFVKICGITNREDALAAVSEGAGALGFIFCPGSPRAVTQENLAEWIHEIPANIWKTGVFVNESPVKILEIGAQLGLDIAQLHGQETPELYPTGMRVWKAFRMGAETGEIPAVPAEAVLLDGPGNGRTFDWSLARDLSQPVVLAGGLTPENVREAIEKTNPWGVDTASGVESSPGRKDHARMKVFIKAALRT